MVHPNPIKNHFIIELNDIILHYFIFINLSKNRPYFFRYNLNFIDVKQLRYKFVLIFCFRISHCWLHTMKGSITSVTLTCLWKLRLNENQALILQYISTCKFLLWYMGCLIIILHQRSFSAWLKNETKAVPSRVNGRVWKITAVIPVFIKLTCMTSEFPSFTAIPVKTVALISSTLVVRTWTTRELSFTPEINIQYG